MPAGSSYPAFYGRYSARRKIASAAQRRRRAGSLPAGYPFTRLSVRDIADRPASIRDASSSTCYESRMSDTVTENLAAILPPLLRSLETLGFIARHFHPPDFGAVMDAAGAPDQDLRAARGQLDGWPDELAGVRGRLQTAADAALAAFEGLRQAPDQADGIRAVFRALRYLPRAKEALYPLAAAL